MSTTKQFLLTTITDLGAPTPGGVINALTMTDVRLDPSTRTSVEEMTTSPEEMRNLIDSLSARLGRAAEERNTILGEARNIAEALIDYDSSAATDSLAIRRLVNEFGMRDFIDEVDATIILRISATLHLPVGSDITAAAEEAGAEFGRYLADSRPFDLDGVGEASAYDFEVDRVSY